LRHTYFGVVYCLLSIIIKSCLTIDTLVGDLIIS